MKLLETLKKIILENREKIPKLFTTPNGIKFFATKHQTIDRFGNLSYDEIKKIILGGIDTGNKTLRRVAVPNIMLSLLIREKYEKILEEMTSNLKEDKIKFVYERKDNDDEEIFDYIEFVLMKDNENPNRFDVITSAFSDDGDFLKLFGRDVTQTKKIILEKYLTISDCRLKKNITFVSLM